MTGAHPTSTLRDEGRSAWGVNHLVARSIPLVRLSLAWAVACSLCVIDLLWCPRVGLSIAGWQTTAVLVCVLLGMSVCYRGRSRAIADMAEAGALWLAFTSAGCVLTYLCATWAWPLHDVALTVFDHALGFDWLTWRTVVLAAPGLHLALLLVYASLLPQIVLSVVLLPAMGRSERSFELLLLAELTLLPTALISLIYPVLGPFATFGGQEATFLPDLLALRAGGPWHFNLRMMEGIVEMPSYHTVLAILFTYAYRGMGPVFWGIAALNGVMLLSIPPIGGHYFVDMIGGAAIAVLCVIASRWWPRSTSDG
jgi:hypothetical protein